MDTLRFGPGNPKQHLLGPRDQPLPLAGVEADHRRVDQVGIEPTQPEGGRFTVCCDSPTSPLIHGKQGAPGGARTRVYGFSGRRYSVSATEA